MSFVVFDIFSGEKTSTKEWPGSMEIKGRVRLDAFEKFLQELPMSRTRAVMVYLCFLAFHLHFYALFSSLSGICSAGNQFSNV